MASALACYAHHLRQVERWTKQLIINELSGLMPAVKANEAKAKAALDDAQKALELPESQLAGNAADIEHAEARAAHYEPLVSVGDIERRVDNRHYFLGWKDELKSLQDKRAQMTEAMQVLYNERNRAQTEYDHSVRARDGLAAAMLRPFESPVAQGTKAYIQTRQPYLNQVLLLNDRDHPEWELAVAELRELCLISGYRTDLLPDKDVGIREHWDDVFADANPPEPAPSGLDVHDELMVTATNSALGELGEHTVNRVDDYRGPVNPRARNEVVPDYMRVP